MLNLKSSFSLKILFHIFYVFLIIIIIDLLSLIFFTKNIKNLKNMNHFGEPFIKYKISNSPRFFHVHDNLLGHDIKMNSNKIKNHQPRDVSPYYVWGNNIGCYDKDYYYNDKRKIIYLAGDSFTESFNPLNRKFGSIIESKTEFRVLKCGVTGTGVTHQFLKFKKIFKILNKKKFQKIIVNFYDNDLDEDRLFPKYRVYKGYMIFDEKNINKNKNKDKFIDDYLVNTNIDFMNRIYLFLKSYSFSSNIINNAIKAYVNSKKIKNKVNLKENTLRINKNHNTINSIKKWAEHSIENNYELTISFICSYNFSDDYYLEIKKHISKLRINIIDTCVSDIFKKEDLSNFSSDGHFSLQGEEKYAKFLIQNIKK